MSTTLLQNIQKSADFNTRGLNIVKKNWFGSSNARLFIVLEWFVEGAIGMYSDS